MLVFRLCILAASNLPDRLSGAASDCARLPPWKIQEVPEPKAQTYLKIGELNKIRRFNCFDIAAERFREDSVQRVGSRYGLVSRCQESLQGLRREPNHKEGIAPLTPRSAPLTQPRQLEPWRRPKKFARAFRNLAGPATTRRF